MQLSTVKENDKFTIIISGKVDTVTAPELERFITENISGIKELVLDLAEVEYVSSAGLRALLQAQKDMNKQGKMKIIHVRDNVKEIFDMIGFSRIFTIE